MTGIIILAAGSSSRLGKPKQNLIYKGATLLQRAIQTAIDTNSQAVVVVTGANADIIEPTIANFEVHITSNTNWQQGMASSLVAGLRALKNIAPGIDSVILMVCDQPFLTAEILDELVKNKSPYSIVACAYNDTLGVPVLFDKIYFDELLALKGQEGARKLLLKFPGAVTAIPFQLGNIDIDTMDDFEKLSR